MFEEKNSGSNLPAQIDIYEKRKLLRIFILDKGGGSMNKTFFVSKNKISFER